MPQRARGLRALRTEPSTSLQRVQFAFAAGRLPKGKIQSEFVTVQLPLSPATLSTDPISLFSAPASHIHLIRSIKLTCLPNHSPVCPPAPLQCLKPSHSLARCQILLHVVPSFPSIYPPTGFPFPSVWAPPPCVRKQPQPSVPDPPHLFPVCHVPGGSFRLCFVSRLLTGTLLAATNLPGVHREDKT